MAQLNVNLKVLLGVALLVTGVWAAAVSAATDPKPPVPDRVATLRAAALEEMRWAAFLDSVYFTTAFEKCLKWPKDLQDRMFEHKAESAIMESTLRVTNPSPEEVEKIASEIIKWRTERFSLLRDIDVMVLRGVKTSPEKSIYSENGGK